jgi:hypothetical protein
MSAGELAARFRAEFVPVTNTFSYFATMPVAEEDLKQYLHEPIAALPPGVCAAVGRVAVLLVPFLEKGNGKEGDMVTFEKPAEGRLLWYVQAPLEGLQVLLFAIQDVDVADYHYTFYNAVAALLAGRWSPETQERYFRLLREELGAEVHGEVDERGWHLKQSLVRRQTNARKETKLFRDYARQSFEDTMTLYLHGICCDIDVETGPRQMPSRYLRHRLELFEALYPPPDGYAVFPDHLRKR